MRGPRRRVRPRLPVELLRAARPDVYVKGGDYTRDTLPEAPLVESLGGTVEILEYLEDRSTTGIIERITAIDLTVEEPAPVVGS